MRRSRKHIDCGYMFYLIAERNEKRAIPCKSRRITGNVNNAFGCHFHCRFNYIAAAAFPRRIKNNNVNFCAALTYAPCRTRSVITEKFGIFNLIEPRILLCVLDSLRYNLNADYFPCPFCH